MRRRDILVASAAGWRARGRAAAPPDESAAFAAESVPQALQALGIALPAAGPELALKALDLVEDGATVEVGVASTLAGPWRLWLLVEKNPNPLAARFDLGAHVAAPLTLRLKVAERCELLAIAETPDGRRVAAHRAVDVIVGGCGDGEIASDAPPPVAPQPTRLRLRRSGDTADVRLLMSHPMETGLRKDASGRPLPAWYIRDVTLRLNGAPLIDARWGSSVSRNPYLQFRLREAAAGDRIGVAWTDTRGARRADEATLG